MIHSQEELRQSLLDLEQELLHVLLGPPDPVRAAELRYSTVRMHSELQRQAAQHQLMRETRQLGVRVSLHIEQLARIVRDQQGEVERRRASVRAESEPILSRALRRQPRERRQEAVYRGTPASSVEENVSEQRLNTSCMRAWFLCNVGHPFPNRGEKDAIITQTNETATDELARVGYSQTVLWFINSRRRSGWTRFLRKYAGNEKPKMLEIAWALEQEAGGTHEQRGWSAGLSITEACGRRSINTRSLRQGLSVAEVCPWASPVQLDEMRHDWSKLLEWVRFGVKERIGDWLFDLMEADGRGTAAAAKARVRKSEHRGKGRQARSTPSSRPPTAPSAPAA